MARSILIVAPASVARKLSAEIGGLFDVIACSDPDRAIALAAAGTYLAIVKVTGYARLTTETPIVRVAGSPAPTLLNELGELQARAKIDQRARARELSYLAASINERLGLWHNDLPRESWLCES